MRPNWCHISLAFFLKFLNFLQAFIGISIILYSIWMLDQWNHHVPIPPPPYLAPSPHSSSSSVSLLPNPQLASVGDFNHVVDLVYRFEDGFGFDLNTIKLPAPWFIYSFMGVGIVLCMITLIGCIAAEAINGCCLCFVSHRNESLSFHLVLVNKSIWNYFK